ALTAPACRDCTFLLFGLPIVFKLLLLEGRCTSGIRSWEQPALWIEVMTKEPQCSDRVHCFKQYNPRDIGSWPWRAHLVWSRNVVSAQSSHAGITAFIMVVHLHPPQPCGN
ncbi:hypothetical protein FN846DRAFT_976916, partial [Sphaerosporella brunnea]